MRLVLIGLVTIAAGLAADVQPVSAQAGSFSNEQYCTQTYGFWGGLDCSYRTWQQCISRGRYCTKNPSWHGSRGKPTTQGKNRRHIG